jgi:hypothetical protein
MVHPVRSLVLACGFGLGVSVMATLLGVGDVILEQARSPVLVGGGDLIVASATGRLGSARFVLSNVLGAPPLRDRVAAASPAQRQYLYLVEPGRTVPVLTRGGVPSRERALGDPETAAVAAWQDAPSDGAWSAPDPGELLRAMDAFHAVPEVPARVASWAEWLYFNGHAGDAHFYLTLLVGAPRPGGRRPAGVRLQLERAGRLSDYSAGAEVDAAELLARAPDLDIGGCQLRLRGTRYEIRLALPAERGGPGVRGELALEAGAGRSMPPFTLRGAGGWQSGYVVPVMSGALGGTLAVGTEVVAFENGRGYHDHNWGFWQGVSWRWGQVQHGDLSIVYGRVFPPAEAADPERLPGFLAAIGPDGPLGFTTEVTIQETSDPASKRPGRVSVRGRGAAVDLTLELDVKSALSTRMGRTRFGSGMDFLQLRGRYQVRGRAGTRELDFEAPGAAETFRRP